MSYLVPSKDFCIIANLIWDNILFHHAPEGVTFWSEVYSALMQHADRRNKGETCGPAGTKPIPVMKNSSPGDWFHEGKTYDEIATALYTAENKLRHCMVWAHTPEGDDFWRNVASQLCTRAREAQQKTTKTKSIKKDRKKLLLCVPKKG